jgi:glucose/mannose-6-phosphate isomerase
MSPPDLDAQATYERLDSEGLYARIAALPDQMLEAWARGSAFALPDGYRDIDVIAVAGVGGSGIGGALMQRLAVDLDAPVGVHTVRGYRLPAFIGERALVIASSNSGNTEETCAALEAAIAARAKCVALATGGRLLEIARAHDVPSLDFTWSGEQRSALGWSFAAPLAMCVGLGLIPPIAVDEAVAEMREIIDANGRDVPESRYEAKQIAQRLAGRLPVFAGAEALAPVAYRWRTQVNENAKSWAIADELPEMNHNAHAGYGLPAESVERLYAVLLRHGGVHPRIALRFDATMLKMREMGVSAEIVEIPGRDIVSQMLRAIALGDFVSYYLGLLNDVHPSPVPALIELKKWMAARE